MTAKVGVGMNIGTYSLWSNKCATMTSLALQAEGVQIPEIFSPAGFVQYMTDPRSFNLPTH